MMIKNPGGYNFYFPGNKKRLLRNRLGYLFLMAFFCTMFIQCSHLPDNGSELINFPEDYPVLHPRYRMWPAPAGNIGVSDNPPVLRWPARLEAGVTYDVRLSQDPGFVSQETISSNDIPWTIFNPHRALDTGSWFWQYRVHNDNWSDVQKFHVGSHAQQVVSPTAEKFLSSIPGAHPRVLIDKEKWPAFIQRVKQSGDVQAILAKADKFLNKPVPDTIAVNKIPHAKDDYRNMKLGDKQSKDLGFGALQGTGLLCKAYLLTGDKRYADKGILWAKAVSRWSPYGQSGVSDFGDAGCMLAQALAFDTFYDLLSPADKKILLNNINVRAGRFYDKWINDIDAKVLSNHVWQFILHYFFKTAVAMHGELKDADNWLTYAYELWLARAPVLGGSEGGWLEGASYFRINMETLLDIPTVIKEYTGFDFINNNKWYAGNANWMFYSFPPGSSADGFGDNIETVKSPGPAYLSYADALSRLTGSRVAATYADRIEQIEKIKLDNANNQVTSENADILRWFRLRYLTGIKRPPALPDSAFPSSIVLRDVGIVDMHSDINNVRNDLMISMRSSPYGGYGHMLADQNTFNVLYGGKRLFYMSGHKVAMKDPHRLEWYKATIGHNGILIDDKGQTFDSEGYGWIPRFLNGKEITYAVGDASMAYGGKDKKTTTGLEKFRRHLLFLHPGLLVVYDELVADHKAKWSWLIHSPQQIYIDSANNQFYCALENASATSALFAMQPLQWALSDTFSVPVVNWMKRHDKKGQSIQYENQQWHLTAATAQRSEKMRFLAIIRVSAGSRQSGKKLNYHLDNQQRIVIDNWTIDAELDPSRPAMLNAYRSDKKAAFTSAGDKITAGDQQYTGKVKGSAKLAEFVGGKWIYKEAADSIPEFIKEIPVNIKN